MIVYGRASALEELDERRKDWKGDRQHREAIEEQEEVRGTEEAFDPAGEDKGSGHAPGGAASG